MKKTFSLFAVFWCFNVVFAQSDFAVFARYDQLRVSPNRDSLVVRCIILDEAHPEQFKMHVLLLPSPDGQPVCLNPQPERFVISGDGKLLLISSPSGMFLISLERKSQSYQIYFRKVGSSWFFENFGFADNAKSIFFKIKNRTAQISQTGIFSLPSKFPKSKYVSGLRLKLISEKLPDDTFQLPVYEIGKYSNLSIPEQQEFLGFVRDSLADFQGNYLLIVKNNKGKKILLTNCRPRLLAPNFDSTKVFVSVFHQNQNKNFIFDPNQQKLFPFSVEQIISVSWINPNRFIFLSGKGLFFQDIVSGDTKKITVWRFPPWAEDIQLLPPKFELQIKSVFQQSEGTALLDSLKKFGFSGRLIPAMSQSRQGFRVRVGGFLSRKEALVAGEKLKQRGFDFWIDEIEDVFEYFNSPGGREAKRFANGFAKIQYQKDDFLKSRVIFVDSAGNFQVLLPPMGSIFEK